MWKNRIIEYYVEDVGVSVSLSVCVSVRRRKDCSTEQRDNDLFKMELGAMGCKKIKGIKQSMRAWINGGVCNVFIVR